MGVTKIDAGYLGSEHGPFLCARCEYFRLPQSCDKVDGVIDEAGCCNFFEENSAKDRTASLLKRAMKK